MKLKSRSTLANEEVSMGKYFVNFTRVNLLINVLISMISYVSQKKKKTF